MILNLLMPTVIGCEFVAAIMKCPAAVGSQATGPIFLFGPIKLGPAEVGLFESIPPACESVILSLRQSATEASSSLLTAARLGPSPRRSTLGLVPLPVLLQQFKLTKENSLASGDGSLAGWVN